VIVSINQALANGVTAFPDGMVPKHPDFILVATANTWGNGTSREYVGRNQLDASTLDRFAMIEWSYDEALEDALTSNKKWLAEVRRIRAIVAEKKIRTVVSPRASITGSKLLAAGLSWDTVKEMLILKSMNDTERLLCK
jgi:cobaltochelatase CobS